MNFLLVLSGLMMGLVTTIGIGCWCGRQVAREIINNHNKSLKPMKPEKFVLRLVK